MPRFEGAFELHLPEGDRTVRKTIVTETNLQKEFWNKVFAMERQLGQQHGCAVSHLFIKALEDIPDCEIKSGEIVAYNSYAL